MELVDELIKELSGLGRPSIKRVLLKHGAQEPFFGVKIGDLKPIEKRLKPNYELALQLYATGVSDAMYLAGLITDDLKMTRDDLNTWVAQAYWSLLSESTVPWVAAGSQYGHELGLEWIESSCGTIACAGWCTLSELTLLKPDTELDLSQYRFLLERVKTSLPQQPDRVRLCMNSFVIACGSNVKLLTEIASACAVEIGRISVSMGDTACKVPFAPESISVAVTRGTIGKKRKTVKC